MTGVCDTLRNLEDYESRQQYLSHGIDQRYYTKV
jgi:hypothetical protein